MPAAELTCGACGDRQKGGDGPALEAVASPPPGANDKTRQKSTIVAVLRVICIHNVHPLSDVDQRRPWYVTYQP